MFLSTQRQKKERFDFKSKNIDFRGGKNLENSSSDFKNYLGFFLKLTKIELKKIDKNVWFIQCWENLAFFCSLWQFLTKRDLIFSRHLGEKN